MLKKNGVLLAVLLLATFALAFSSAASAQEPQAPPAAQTVQPAAPLPAFLTAPAAQTPAPAVTPANGSSSFEWKASCTCSTDAVCVPYGMECCFWPKQTCGICC